MPELPRGTVAFLFTDIEGSTRLWETDREATLAAVERHIALLDEAIAAHRGILFKTVGDAVQAVFETAPDAVAAALAGQQTILAEAWGAAGPLRVRMALHAGDAEPDAHGDYLAAPLNRLSRLLATGYGGQILVSHAVQQLTRGALPAAASLRDLGEHRLRDLLDAERVFQLVHPNLANSFPALKSLDARPHNLPLQPTPLIGRERDAAHVVAALRRPEVRLLTLTGAAGAGKTRLSLQAAAELADDFADGVWFVALAALSDPALVLPTIAETLDVRETGGMPQLETLFAGLETKELLLVLDNFEQVAAAAPDVAALLTAAPGVKILVSSRVPLRVRGEHEYPVPPLPLPRRRPPPTLEQMSQFEAVRLFVERAQAVRPDFAVTNETAPAVAEICHRLDGLPLAIELAAARSKILPPAAMLGRLEKRLPLLTGGARDLPERQRTLRAAIAWSYDLLAPGEQALFRRLAVFAGGCAFAAAEAVANPDCELELDLFDGLAALVDHSLLRQAEGPDGEPRFGMLETIREFGLEQLEATGEAEPMRDRHASEMLTLAEQADPELDGPNQGAWLERLEVEHDNMRSALTWTISQRPVLAVRLAGALGKFWDVRGHWAEGMSWLERAMANGAAPEDASWRRALAGASQLAYRRRDLPLSERLANEFLRLAQEAGDRKDEAEALNAIAAIAHDRFEWERVALLADAVLTIRRELGDPIRIGNSVYNAGLSAVGIQDMAKAAACFEESLAIARKVGDASLASASLTSLASTSLARGDLALAHAQVHEGLALAREIGDQLGVMQALLDAIGIAIDRNDLAGAAVQCDELLGLSRHLGARWIESGCLIWMAELAALAGDLDRAMNLLHEALAISRQAQDLAGAVDALLGLSAVARARAMGAPDASSLAQAAEILDARPMARYTVLFLHEAVLLAMPRGQHERASRWLGAMAARRAVLGTQARPRQRKAEDEALATARAALGNEAFDAAWAEGQRLSPAAALAEAVPDFGAA